MAMSRLGLSLGAAIIVVSGSDGLAAPQAREEGASAKVWLGRAAEYEEFLKKTEVVRMEAIPVGVTKPIRCYFAPGGLVESMVLKSIKPGRQTGFWESYRSEMAAYELDKLLELQMIPPTVEKRVKSELGAAVMWIAPVQSFKQMGGPPSPPPEHAEAWNRQMAKAKMFDNLINNRDPNLGNWLVDPAWNLILIDHTRAFAIGKDMVHKMNRIEKGLWERMLALELAPLKAALDPFLDGGQIKDLLGRRDKMKQEIDKMVAARGEADVFFP
jgi:hypothetical protein